MAKGLGFIGSGGAVGAADALEKIIAQRMLEQKLEEQRQQQEFENRMALRAADTGDSRFERTQGFTEETGRAGIGLRRDEFGLSKERFGHDQSQDFRRNRNEDEDRTIAAQDRTGRADFIRNLAGDPNLDQNMRRIVQGLQYNVTVPDTRTAAQRGTDAGVEEESAFNAGGRRVRQATVDMGTASGIAQSNAAAANRPKPETSTQDTEAQETAAEVKRLASLLRNHPGRDGAFGVVNARLPTLRQDTADAEALLASLQGLLTLDNMEKMKGVLSDNDMKILRAASTTLSGSMSQGAAEAELRRLEGLGGASAAANTPKSETPAERAARLRKTYGGGR